MISRRIPRVDPLIGMDWTFYEGVKSSAGDGLWWPLLWAPRNERFADGCAPAHLDSHEANYHPLEKATRRKIPRMPLSFVFDLPEGGYLLGPEVAAEGRLWIHPPYVPPPLPASPPPGSAPR